ncbi:aminotransferase class III-fold pyridoxal phosphate-dependent enzyme [Alphaproteobacteria bacterium]|nr:aminotransferase class III-fold pyridoxal phosphate-dependent enzyme [Alphaproteobacteria bacterium]
MKLNTKYQNISGLGKYFRLSNSPPVFRHGDREFLFDENNKMYIDLACGSGTSILGHNNKYINKNIKNIIDEGVLHTGPHFISSMHLKYFTELSNFFKNKFDIFNMATNGSEATETALKLAFHHTKKNKIFYFTGSYHGRTGYSLLSSSMKGINKNIFKNKNFIECKFNDIDDFKKKYEIHKKDLAAVIIEPIQATSGFNFSNNNFLKSIKTLTKKNNSLLIFDEVWTGFGKTGFNFAFEYYDIIPDIIILGKSIGGGMPLGLIAFNKKINHYHPGAQSSTFQGNIISINTSYFLLKHLKKIKYLIKIKKIENFIANKKQFFKSFKFVKDFKGIGFMWGIEIDNSFFSDDDYTNKIRKDLLEKGLITWECGKQSNVIGLIPPLCISNKSLNRSFNIIFETFKELQS